MNSQNRNSFSNHSACGDEPSAAEATLRLIARLPAPEGLEDRVHARLAADLRKGRILAWPTTLKADSGWMRTAAAAAIVFVVAGGGWGIYSRIPQPPSAKTILLQPRGPVQGGFSSSGAMRTPQTLNGPLLINPATPKLPATKAPFKTPGHPSLKPIRHGQLGGSSKNSVQPVAPVAK
jgi:hypothetical protein